MPKRIRNKMIRFDPGRELYILIHEEAKFQNCTITLLMKRLIKNELIRRKELRGGK
jgi:hypothetical protein